MLMYDLLCRSGHSRWSFTNSQSCPLNLWQPEILSSCHSRLFLVTVTLPQRASELASLRYDSYSFTGIKSQSSWKCPSYLRWCQIFTWTNPCCQHFFLLLQSWRHTFILWVFGEPLHSTPLEPSISKIKQAVCQQFTLKRYSNYILMYFEMDCQPISKKATPRLVESTFHEDGGCFHCVSNKCLAKWHLQSGEMVAILDFCQTLQVRCQSQTRFSLWQSGNILPWHLINWQVS